MIYTRNSLLFTGIFFCSLAIGMAAIGELFSDAVPSAATEGLPADLAALETEYEVRQGLIEMEVISTIRKNLERPVEEQREILHAWMVANDDRLVEQLARSVALDALYDQRGLGPLAEEQPVALPASQASLRNLVTAHQGDSDALRDALFDWKTSNDGTLAYEERQMMEGSRDSRAGEPADQAGQPSAVQPLVADANSLPGIALQPPLFSEQLALIGDEAEARRDYIAPFVEDYESGRSEIFESLSSEALKSIANAYRDPN